LPPAGTEAPVSDATKRWVDNMVNELAARPPDDPCTTPDYSETDWDALRAAYPRDAERVKRAMFIVSAATEN
ncbi:hypothetical protein GR254_09115, partial [Mycobacterium tuberculosis]|nr:hypothetical protein [Mycobacterium tuberculosis]